MRYVDRASPAALALRGAVLALEAERSNYAKWGFALSETPSGAALHDARENATRERLQMEATHLAELGEAKLNARKAQGALEERAAADVLAPLAKSLQSLTGAYVQIEDAYCDAGVREALGGRVECTQRERFAVRRGVGVRVEMQEERALDVLSRTREERAQAVFVHSREHGSECDGGVVGGINVLCHI